MKYLAGFDVGSQNIRVAIGEIKRGGGVTILSLLKMPSGGIRRGTVDNVVDATRALSNTLSEMKKIAAGATKNIILGVGSGDVKVQQSKGVVAVSRADDEIYQDDIQRVIQSSQAVSLPPNRMVLHYLTGDFTVDGLDHVRDPLGMVGKRLEINTLIIDALAPSVKNITRCFETLGAGITSVMLGPLAAGRAVLSKNQTDLGVILIDIGFSKTSIAIYEEGRLIHAAIIPVGSSSITNDLAIGLRIPTESAETIKLSLGSALAREVPARDVIELNKVDAKIRGTVTKKSVAEIIEARLAEILELVNNEIKRTGKIAQLPAGAVLVGGGVKLPNIIELTRQELKVASQIGIPDISAMSAASGDLNLQAEDPEFATAIGLLLMASDELTEPEANAPKPVTGLVKKILNYFIP